jgi:hypothetical protein
VSANPDTTKLLLELRPGLEAEHREAKRIRENCMASSAYIGTLDARIERLADWLRRIDDVLGRVEGGEK